jgi:PHP family Zn ribbon phosphoesterase
MDITGLLESIERAGGYAALFGLFCIGLFVLVNKQMNQQAERSSAREAENARKHIEEMSQERANAAEHRADKLMLLASQEKLASTLQELSGVMKGAMTEQRETRREVSEMRREVAEIRREVSERVLPKHNAERKVIE